MFRERSDALYRSSSEAGDRQLFTLGQYRFHDTLDGDGALHHFVTDTAESEVGPGHYEMDRVTMYEFMARYLAGEYEMEAYSLDHSPGHDDLLDVLEIATARARAGETDFSWDEFDPAETEVLDDVDDEGEGEGEGEEDDEDDEYDEDEDEDEYDDEDDDEDEQDEEDDEGENGR